MLISIETKPEICTPFISLTGYVDGTFIITDLPLARFQNGGDFKSLKFGNFILYESGCKSIKPKIPWSAGFVPVMIDDQATEEISGIDERIGVRNACWIISEVLGITPVWAKFLSMPKGTPSKPIITVLAFSAISLVNRGNYSACTDVFVMDDNEASQFLNVIEVFDGYWFFCFDDDFGNFKILYDIRIFGNDFVC